MRPSWATTTGTGPRSWTGAPGAGATEYRGNRPRFVAEFGFQGPPAWATLVRAIHDDPLRPDSPGVLLHQKAADGNGKLTRGHAGHLPAPATFTDWHWATSLNQARAVTLGVEHFRSLTPLCMGAVVWQLNDVWPVISWSAVDGDGRAYWHFVEDVDAALPNPRLAAHAERTDAGYRISVTAGVFVRDLTVLADRVAADAHVDEALVTLLPGETTTFEIHTAASVPPEAFLDPLVLRSANQLVADIIEAGGGMR